MNQRAIVKLSGRVQGVGYRYFALQQAQLLNLVGYVKNQGDGSLYVIVEGMRETILEYLKLLHQGPRFARVDEMSVEWSDATQEYADFSVRF